MDLPAQEPVKTEELTQPVVKSVEPTKKSKKGLWIFLGVVFVSFILLAGVGGFYLGNMKKSPIEEKEMAQSTPTPTFEADSIESEEGIKEEANLFTYITKTDPKLSFKYPVGEEWKVTDNKVNVDNGNLSTVIVKYDTDACGPNCGNVFSIRTYKKGSAEDPGQTYGEKQMNGNVVYTLSSKDLINNSGITGTRWEYDPSSKDIDKVVYYYFYDDNYAYVVDINSNGAFNEDPNYTVVGDKIAKTLKFNQE